MPHVKQCKWPKLFFFLSSGLFSSHLPGKNAGDFHILTAICSFLSKAHQVFLTHRKHIKIDCVSLCVSCMCVSVSRISLRIIIFFSVHSFFRIFFYLIRLLFNRIFPLSCTLPLCCHNDDFRVLQEEECTLLFYSQVKHTSREWHFLAMFHLS